MKLLKITHKQLYLFYSRRHC